ncbi:hypothetical protein EYC80_005135 [Monilinia laxa]|uniref:FAD-binding domain-containing protein n=1 Tax=Monilinia laxa TaxID=61186 RepID=A0A5N6KJ06_MONLA|nr:hypothetical protein EYC80_005135 [Monilinia laxa]
MFNNPDMACYMSPLRIAIIGAGPSGLILASLFHRNQSPFTIYDLRSRPSSALINIPSGSLDLHVESGQLALSKCGLLEEFRSLTTECSEDHIICDRFGDTKFETNSRDGERPEISRNNLIELLLSSIPEDTIQWEHKVISLSPNPTNPQQQIITFQDCSSHICDLRIHWLTLTVPNITERIPEMAKMVGTGNFWALGGTRAILTQRSSMDSVRMYVTIHNEDVNHCHNVGLNSMDFEKMKEKLLGESGAFGDFGQRIKNLLAIGLEEEKTAGFLQMYMFAPDHAWEHKANATLVGDAAHLMTPFAGEGFNSAMLDALELAQGIIMAVRNETSLSDAVREYEMTMFVRAKANAEETVTNLKKIFENDAPKTVVEWFNSMGAGSDTTQYSVNNMRDQQDLISTPSFMLAKDERNFETRSQTHKIFANASF